MSAIIYIHKKQTKWINPFISLYYYTLVYFFPTELEIYQKKGFIDHEVLILTVEDPKARVGSGGATLNALLVVTEHLSAQEGFTVSSDQYFV